MAEGSIVFETVGNLTDEHGNIYTKSTPATINQASKILFSVSAYSDIITHQYLADYTHEYLSKYTHEQIANGEFWR